MTLPGFNDAWTLLARSQNVLLTTHEGTDGDDLGSLLAVLPMLRRAGKRVAAAVKGGVPRNLQFLSGSEQVAEGLAEDKYDLLITFGCNRLDRTGWPSLQDGRVPIINFDHHPDNTNFGTVNVVDPTASSVAELIYHFLNHQAAVIDKDMATALLTGIFTDTGGFKHANTTAAALEAAADLLKKGARIDKIAGQVMGRKRSATLRAWAKGLENTRFDPDKQMVFSVLTEDDLREAGATDEDLEGFVELLNNIPQAKFALLLRQDGEQVKGSLRSEHYKGVDVSQIAKSFGGGGHKLASGFKLPGRLKRDRDVWKIES